MVNKFKIDLISNKNIIIKCPKELDSFKRSVIKITF